MANTLVIIVLIHTRPRTKLNVLSAKAATKSEINLVAVTRMTKGRAVEGKGVEKAKVKARKAPGASLQVQRAAMLRKLRLLYINFDVNNDGVRYT